MDGYRILVPLDGTPQAAAALPFARGLAAALSAQILLLRVASSFGSSSDSAVAAERYLERVAHELRGAGIAVQTLVTTGEPAESIVAEVDRNAADLVVLATRKAGLERAILGSTASRVLRRSSAPVITLRPGQRRVTRVQRILLPIDATPDRTRVVPFVTGIARALGASIVLLRVADPAAAAAEMPADLATLEAGLHRVGLDCRALVRGGGPVAEVILDIVADEGIDLVAMTTHGRGPVGAALFGSVTDEVMRRVPVPVMAISTAVLRAHAPA